MEINVLTHTVIGCAYKVHNTLGFGFLEKVYENALKVELQKQGTVPGNNSSCPSFMKVSEWDSTTLIYGSTIV